MADVGAIGTARSDGENGGDHGQRDEDQRAAVHQHALAADAVDQQDARGHTDDLEDGQDQCLLEGRGLRDADRFEQGVGVEEDAVGAGQLLEGGERHAHADEATPLRTQYGEDAKGLVDAAERALDGLDLRGDIVGAGQTLKHLGGLLVPALGDQIARRLGDERHEDHVDQGRHDQAQEHALPRLDAEKHLGGRIAGEIGHHQIDDRREEQAEDDSELAEGDQASADARRGDLGDVSRGDGRRSAEAHATDDAAEQQERVSAQIGA